MNRTCARIALACAALVMMHLSRFCEELILWMSPRYRSVQLADRFCTGSSMMPQKKNADFLELARGASGVFAANAAGSAPRPARRRAPAARVVLRRQALALLHSGRAGRRHAAVESLDARYMQAMGGDIGDDPRPRAVPPQRARAGSTRKLPGPGRCRHGRRGADLDGVVGDRGRPAVRLRSRSGSAPPWACPGASERA